MTNIQNHFIEIINKQLFRDAAEKAIFLLALYQNKETKNEKAIKLINDSEQLIYRISNTQVINPMQYDNLYADVLNSIKSVITETEKLPNINQVWEQFQTNDSKIERYILNENIAVCNNIFTKDGHNIAFCFAFEDRYFEYDEQVFILNPACFYMENREVLAVADRAQGLLSLENYLTIAKKHPTDAISIIDNKTRLDIISGQKSDLMEGDKMDWYW
jgi:hypothetical protein